MVLGHGAGANDEVPVSVEPLSALAVTLSGSAPGTAISLHRTEGGLASCRGDRFDRGRGRRPSGDRRRAGRPRLHRVRSRTRPPRGAARGPRSPAHPLPTRSFSAR
ncbi:MAG: hypothetical protein M5U09_00245 [Gammaproteobacteria bacterium]|nr:hypothetical protein [Gammaproteobacteria bacterium]